VEEEPDPSTILTPEEADELGALDLVGLTDDFGTTDGADDIIDPTPEVLEEDLIEKLPLLPGNKKLRGIDTINQAITLLNSGIQAVEESSQTGVDEDGKCKFIKVAKGKKGFLGVGKRRERKVSREDTQKKLDLVKQDIEAQRASKATIIATKSGVPTYVSLAKLATFGRASASTKVGSLGAIATITRTGAGRATVPRGSTPMRRDAALKVLEATAKELQKILDKECN
jgi:hypothetical protein